MRQPVWFQIHQPEITNINFFKVEVPSIFLTMLQKAARFKNFIFFFLKIQAPNIITQKKEKKNHNRIGLQPFKKIRTGFTTIKFKT